MNDKKKLQKKLDENLAKQKKYYHWWRQPPAKLVKEEFKLRLKLGQNLMDRGVVTFVNN